MQTSGRYVPNPGAQAMRDQSHRTQSEAIDSALLKSYMQEIKANHKNVKLCKAQCRLISRRLGVIFDVLQRMPNAKPSPGLLSAFQDACFLLTKMTVTEEEEQCSSSLSAIENSHNFISMPAPREQGEGAESQGVSQYKSIKLEGGGPRDGDEATSTVAHLPPPRWLFMLRQRFICATIFNNFRQRLRKVWSLQPTHMWEDEDLKAQKEDEEAALKTLVEYAHVFQATPMSLPTTKKGRDASSTIGGSSAFGANSPQQPTSGEVDIDRLRQIMRRAGTSAAWKIDPNDVLLPPNGYFSFEMERAQQHMREKGLLDRKAEALLEARKKVVVGVNGSTSGPLGRQLLQQQQMRKGGINVVDDMRVVMSPVGVKKTRAKGDRGLDFDSEAGFDSSEEMAEMCPAATTDSAPPPPAAVTAAVVDREETHVGANTNNDEYSDKEQPVHDHTSPFFSHAEHQTRFRIYLNGSFQRVPFVVLKELDPSLTLVSSRRLGHGGRRAGSGGGGLSHFSSLPSATNAELDPATMESFVIDITARRGWCHPHLVEVIGGYAEILTETVDEDTGLTELGAIPALGAVVEQIPTQATVARRQQLRMMLQKAIAERERRRNERRAQKKDPSSSPSPSLTSPSAAVEEDDYLAMYGDEEAAWLLMAEENEQALASIPKSWQGSSSRGLYSTLSDMLFVQRVRFTLPEIIDVARQVAEAMQYMSFDVDNVTRDILKTWVSVTPSNIYLREVHAHHQNGFSSTSKSNERERMRQSKFQVRVLPRFHIHDGPVNRWDPPFDAESPPAYAVAQLMIAMMTRIPPYPFAESQLELVALIEPPSALEKALVRIDSYINASSGLSASYAASGATAASSQRRSSLVADVPHSDSLSRFDAASSQGPSLYDNQTTITRSIGATSFRPTSASSTAAPSSTAALQQQQPSPSPSPFPRGVDIPAGLPSFFQDFFARCLLRRSDYSPDIMTRSGLTPRLIADVLGRGLGRVSIAELRQVLSDVFYSSEENFSLMFDTSSSPSSASAPLMSPTEELASVGERERQQIVELKAALGAVAGSGVGLEVASGRIANRRGEDADDTRYDSLGQLLEYGTEPQYDRGGGGPSQRTPLRSTVASISSVGEVREIAHHLQAHAA